MSTSYRIDVIGQTWSGFRGSYSRPLKGPMDLDAIQNPDALKPWFGDFESIEDYRVTRLEHGFERKGRKSVSVHTEEVVRDWQNEENEMAFEEMNR